LKVHGRCAILQTEQKKDEAMMKKDGKPGEYRLRLGYIAFRGLTVSIIDKTPSISSYYEEDSNVC
jgi:hypothetical protein